MEICEGTTVQYDIKNTDLNNTQCCQYCENYWPCGNYQACYRRSLLALLFLGPRFVTPDHTCEHFNRDAIYGGRSR